MRVPVTPLATLPTTRSSLFEMNGVNGASGVGCARVGEHTGLAAVERHRPGLAVAVDLHVEPLRERVHDRGADTVESAGCRVRAAAELAARVQLGEDHLDAGEAGLRFDVDRDAAGPVAHLDRVVGVEDDVDLGAVATEGLVDRVVDDLPQAVHEPARVGGSDVHARALAHGFEPLENGEVAGGVVGAHFTSVTARSVTTPAPPRGSPSRTAQLPNCCTQYRVPPAASIEQAPIMVNCGRMMFSRCLGEFIQPLTTADVDE